MKWIKIDRDRYLDAREQGIAVPASSSKIANNVRWKSYKFLAICRYISCKI